MLQLFLKLLEGISHPRVPEVLVEQRNVLLDSRWEIPVVTNLRIHPLFVKVIDFVQNYVYPFLEIALLLAVDAIKFPVKLYHRVFSLGIGAFFAIGHKFQDSVLNKDDPDLFSGYPFGF